LQPVFEQKSSLNWTTSAPRRNFLAETCFQYEAQQPAIGVSNALGLKYKTIKVIFQVIFKILVLKLLFHPETLRWQRRQGKIEPPI
jgi:hypothetical protein